MNINFGSISSSKRNNFLNGCGAYHLWGNYVQKNNTTIFISKKNPKFA